MPRVAAPQPIFMSMTAQGKAPKSKPSPLTIVLDHEDQIFYYPGDVISGRVCLDGLHGGFSPTISCHGVARVKIHETQSRALMTYGARVVFFNLEQTLADGQRLEAFSRTEWQFAIALPQTIDPKLFNGQTMKHSRLFQPNDNLAHPLPPRFLHLEKALYGMTGRSTWAHIEYVLEVKIKSSGVNLEATKLFNFEPLFAPGPVEDYKLATTEIPVTFKSAALTSNGGGSKLFGFRDRSRSVFNNDSLPRLTINTIFRYPTVLQPYHPLTDPFMFSASYTSDGEPTSIDPKRIPAVLIKSLRICLYAHSTVRAESRLQPEGVLDGKVYRIVLCDEQNLDKVVTLTGPGEREKIIDLGTLCKIRLTGAPVGAAKEWPLTPSFSTWIITRWYKLEWELSLQCGDKVEKISNTKDKALVVVAPAEPDKEMNPDRHMAPEYEDAGGRSSDEVMDGLFGRTATQTSTTSNADISEQDQSTRPKTKAELVEEEREAAHQRELQTSAAAARNPGTGPAYLHQDEELPPYQP